MLPPYEMPQPLGIFAGEQLVRAGDYLDAFERLAKTPAPQPLYPMYFLFAHCLELLFKSFLAARGVPKKKLKEPKLRHDLIALLDLCEAKQLPEVTDLRTYVASIQEMNSDHDFRYVTNYSLSLPGPSHCIAIAKKLKDTIGPIVSEAATIDQVTLAAMTRHLKGRKIRWSC
ncbi:hypothetical protein [Bradyrhizobium japonicum]|uniref:hypothetical protein n=1 Tax=Bradyrhizobium japonicum TaxID=375 RepID=UPI00271493AD|nr:hypothetical protein [Bradyrhizobium japonicum]WLB58755.1 hypothetical protein QIH94_23110 [Bradyrhizobium japonicum]WLB59444.1 hypothetical protein QIH96_23220 [Bradyrhizobium japonicum]